MKKVDEVDKQRKEGKGLFGIVDILVKIILLIMISLLSRFRIYTPPPPTPTLPLEISIDDQFTIEDIIAFEFIPLNININVGDNFYIDDSISYTFIGNEISINVNDVFYLDDTPSMSLQYIPINISVTDSFTIEDNTSMQFGTNVVNVSAEDIFNLDDTPSMSFQYVPINISVEDFFDLEDSVSTSFQYVPINISAEDPFYLDDTPSISLQQIDWLVGWNYRKSHVINPSSGAGTNYQVKITVHYGSGTDSGADVYLGGKCKTDFGDIRFTRSDKITLIDYWMEDKVDGDYATFWVEVPDDLSSNSATIYIYYGNSSATTTSNGDNTFLFFDDFSGTDINTDKWTVIGSNYITWSIDNGAVRSTVVSPPPEWGIAILKSNYSPTYNQLIHAKVKVGSGTNIAILYRWADSNNFITGYLQSPNKLYMSEKYGGTWYENYVTFTWSAGNWYDLEVMEVSANSFVARVGTTTVSKSVHSISGYFALQGPFVSGGYGWFDNVYVRKYVSPEPSHGSWGSEESR